jgi:large subunit ribosomal protein L5
MSNLKKKYIEEIRPEMQKSGFKNVHSVPRLQKVIVNVGIGKIRANQKFTEIVVKNLTAVTGQKPIIRKAKKAIAGFKVREGDEVGLMVTLRSDKMYDFLHKLANVALPRLRDFRGLDPKSFDSNANITLGIKERVVFPEISHEAENIHGMEVTIVTTAKNKQDAQKLLESLGFPFKEKNNG